MEQIKEEKTGADAWRCVVLKNEKYVKDQIMREHPQRLDLWRFYEIGFWFSERTAKWGLVRHIEKEWGVGYLNSGVRRDDFFFFVDLDLSDLNLFHGLDFLNSLLI